MQYVNDGKSDRFVARDLNDHSKFYPVYQGGIVGGKPVDYVRVDETLNVSIHSVHMITANGSVFCDEEPLDVNITWS